MICPSCKKAEIISLYIDSMECTDCGATVNIEYCFCPTCRYSFRLNNGEFLDEMQMTTDALDEVVENLEELLEEFDEPLEMSWSDTSLRSMLDLVNPCVRCGSSVTIHNDRSGEYECLDCGFKWEILKNE
jgi:hypothetical protein